MASNEDLDAIVIGAGFAGMYALHRLRDEMGWGVRVFERGADVGGTWYWNRYPGARCDVESMYYSYSFSPELEQEWEWTERYSAQPEILSYANHVADRFDLRRSISFETDVRSATFDETMNRWTVELADGEVASARFLISAVGCLSAARTPELPGLADFAGELHHTGQWPHEGVDFTGKHVGVIGTGSSAIQAIPQIAAQAAHLTVFQRTAAYTIPALNRALESDEVAAIKGDYRAIRETNKTSLGGIPYRPSLGKALDYSAEVRTAEMQKRWDNGGTALVTVFSDTVINLEANEVTAQFVRDRIADIVDDPQTAALLSPHDFPFGAKRMCLDTGYFATYNRDNVNLVGVKDTPIERITAAGIVVDGAEHRLDALVLATGYDAMTGPLNAIAIRGVGGILLRDEWADGPHTFLGVSSAGFPNLFMLTGPGSPSVLTNMFISIEQHVDFVCELLTYAKAHDIARIDCERAEQEQWVAHVNEVASYTLFPQAASWYMGANVPGKTQVFMPYIGGMGAYRQKCDDVVANGYRGFTFTSV